MNEAPLAKDKKAFWRFRHAQQCFEYARTTSDHVLTEQWPPNHRLIYQISISVVVLYTRPFTDCYGLGKLQESIVPSEYESKHKRLIAMRNKVFAHYDTTNFDDSTIADLRPKVRLNLTGTEAFIEMTETPLLPAAFEQLREMSFVLEEKCRWHLKKIGEKYKKVFPKTVGVYDLDLGELNEFFSNPT